MSRKSKKQQTKKRKHLVVRAIVEFAVDPKIDCVDSEAELIAGLTGELVKVKSGEFENRLYGGIISVSPVEGE